MTKKGAFYAAISILCLGGLWYLRHRTDRKADKQISSQALPKKDNAEFIIDETHHKITTVSRQPNGSGGPGSIVQRSSYLPPHAKVEIGNDGSIKVDARIWGTELSPQFGFAYSDKARAFLGLSVLYYNRLELVPFVAIGISHIDGRIGAALAYNVYSNTRLFVGMQTNGTPVGGISFNF